jgi:hypothetical protein
VPFDGLIHVLCSRGLVHHRSTPFADPLSKNVLILIPPIAFPGSVTGDYASTPAVNMRIEGVPI